MKCLRSGAAMGQEDTLHREDMHPDFHFQPALNCCNIGLLSNMQFCECTSLALLARATSLACHLQCPLFLSAC